MQSPTTKRFAFALISLGSFTFGAQASCVAEKIFVKGDFGSVRFHIEIADDAQERARGLMHRESIGTMGGMLFVYDTPGNLTFWMKNTLIPLDMIFIRPDGTISHIHQNAIPHDETPISGGEGNLAVLEIWGGMANRLGIEPGSVVRHPAFSQTNPVWPCD